MKTNRILRTIHIVVLAFGAVAATAQTPSSAYFLDGSFQSHKLNPAITPERGYFSVPVLGQTALSVNTNLNLADYLYQSESDPDKLVTFMSSQIDRTQFLNAIPKTTDFAMDVNIDVLNIGFRAFGGYNTLGVAYRMDGGLSIPKEFFSLLKSGMSDGDYSVEDITMSMYGYAEIALGHSHRITDNLTVGAKFKLLGAANYMDFSIDRIDAHIGSDKWRVQTVASANLAMGDVVIYDENGELDDMDFDNASMGSSGFGLAMDLGAVYDMSDVLDGLKVSVALTDLGSLRLDDAVQLGTDPTKVVEFEGFDGYDLQGDDSNIISDTMDEIGENLKDMIEIKDKGTGTVKKQLATRFRAGAEYDMPFLNWMSVGELVTLKTGNTGYLESRTYVNVEPCSFFDASLNVGVSKYGTSLGWIVNLHPVGFNLFIASDAMRSAVDVNDTPVGDCALNVAFGVNIPIGKKI